MTTADILIERELRGPAPRPVRSTAPGRRTLLLSLAPPASLAILAALYAFAAPSGWQAAAFGGCALLASGPLLRLVLLWRSRARLVAQGVAVTAAVVEKETLSPAVTQYYAWYRASGKHWGVGWLGDSTDAEIGDAVTVLHAAQNPAEAVVYRACGYTARIEAVRQRPEYPRI